MKRFIVDALDIIDGLLLFWWPIVLLVGIGIYSECHKEEYRYQQYIRQAVKDDEVYSILLERGGIHKECYWHYELVVPVSGNDRVVAFYLDYIQHRKQYPVRDATTKEVYEVLQTRGITYKRVYVGEQSSISQAIEQDHPRLCPELTF